MFKILNRLTGALEDGSMNSNGQVLCINHGNICGTYSPERYSVHFVILKDVNGNDIFENYTLFEFTHRSHGGLEQTLTGFFKERSLYQPPVIIVVDPAQIDKKPHFEMTYNECHQFDFKSIGNIYKPPKVEVN